MSVDKPINTGDLSGLKIGVVDILGRKPMVKFITGLLKAKVEVKRVTKNEDLLPLLTFGSVKAIFIPKSMFSSLKQKSNLNLIINHIDVKVGLASTALNNKQNTKTYKKCIGKLNAGINKILGVDQWKDM